MFWWGGGGGWGAAALWGYTLVLGAFPVPENLAITKLTAIMLPPAVPNMIIFTIKSYSIYIPTALMYNYILSVYFTIQYHQYINVNYLIKFTRAGSFNNASSSGVESKSCVSTFLRLKTYIKSNNM